MKKGYEYEIIKVLRSSQTDDKNRIDLHVIRWSSGSPVFEKRRVFEDSDEGDKFRKLVGLNADDIDFIVRNADDIKDLLND